MDGLRPDAERIGSAEMTKHQQTVWENQCKYVAGKSVFYQHLWAEKIHQRTCVIFPNCPCQTRPSFEFLNLHINRLVLTWPLRVVQLPDCTGRPAPQGRR